MKTVLKDRLISVLLVLVMIISLMPTMAIHSVAEEATGELPVLNETIVGTVDFQSFNFLGDNSTGDDGVDYKSTFYYTDDFFAPSAINGNADSQKMKWSDLEDVSLAATSMDFAVASYTTNDKNVLGNTRPSYNNTDYSNKDVNARQFLETCKFKNFKSVNYTRAPQQDTIAYVLAHKKIKVFDEEDGNKEYDLVAVGIRGAGYGAEWANNVTIGTAGQGASVRRHEGFDTSAQTVCAGIERYIDDYNLSDNVKYWVVGFSRSAAVANLTAGYLTDEASKYRTRQKDIYGYTYEAPQAAYNAGSNTKSQQLAMNYKNIHNILNAMDAVPKVSPSGFQHQRLGIDYYMPYYGNTDNNSDINTMYYSRMWDILQTIAIGTTLKSGERKTDPLIEAVDPNNYPYNRKLPIYTISATKLLLDAGSGNLKNFGTELYDTGSSKYLGDKYIDEFIDDLIDVFLVSTAWDRGTTSTHDVITHRTRFINNYQEDFRTLLGYLLDYSGPAFLGLVDDLIKSIEGEIGLTNIVNIANLTGFAFYFVFFYNNPTGKVLFGKTYKQGLIDESKTVATRVVNRMVGNYTSRDGITKAQMNEALEHLVELVVDLYADEKVLYDSQYFGTCLHWLNEILCTHEQETVLSWNMAVDPNHINRGYRTITVPKETDVKLFEFRDRYADLEGTLSSNGAGALVAEYKNGAAVRLTTPDGREVENLDQRISVSASSDGTKMTIRYPSSLNIRTDISAMDENSYLQDIDYQVADYMPSSIATAVSDGRDQYDPEKTNPSNYIPLDANHTNASEINGYNSYRIPLSCYDTLQIMAKGTKTFDNSADGDNEVYTIHKKSYANTIVEGQFRNEAGDVTTYLPYVMDQNGDTWEPAAMEERVSYSSVHGVQNDTTVESGTGNGNPKAKQGNKITITLPAVENNNKVVRYFVTNSEAENNTRLSSETEAYLPDDTETGNFDSFVHDTKSSIKDILEAEDQVYHVYYGGDFRYTVLWKNWDGTELEKDLDVLYNSTPEYNGETPQRASSSANTEFVFVGWNPKISEDSKVTSDMTFEAVFKEREKTPATFTLVHSDGTRDTITETNPGDTMDITVRVKNGMYGGLFESEDFKTPAKTPGNKLLPENGMTYYLREIPKTYFTVRNVYLSQSGKVVGSYGVAVTDCNLYREVGFYYGDDYIPSIERNGKSSLYDSVTFTSVNGGKPYYPKDLFSKTEFPSENAKIAVARLADAANGSVQTYWITADNVLVVGNNIRNLKDGIKDGEDQSPAYGTGDAPKTLIYQETGLPVWSHYEGTFVEEDEEPADNGINLAGYTASLNGNIAMNFYLELSEEVAADKDAYMQFKLPGTNHTEEVVALKDAQKVNMGGKTYYVFSAGIAAKDMTSNIQAQFIKGDKTTSEEWNYTIKEYCDYIRNHPDAYDAESVALAEAMLNYGGYTQKYFNHNVKNLANEGLNVALPEVEPDDSFNPEESGACEGLTYLGTSAMLTTVTALNHYFEFKGDPSDYTFTANGKELKVETDSNGSYVQIAGVKAKDLDKPVTLTVKDKAGNTYTLNYSVYTNVMQVVAGEFPDNAKNMMKALYGYGEAAKAYFASRS